MTYQAPPPPPPASPARPEDDRAPGATAYPGPPAPDRWTRSAPAPLTTPTYHRRHRGFRLAGLAVVGLLVVAGTVSTVPEMVRDSVDETFPLPAGTVELDVRGDAGDVVVREVAEGRPTGITASKHWSFREPTAEVTTAGGVTSVSLDCAPGVVGQCYADWTIAVPPGLKVVVRPSVGDVDVSGVTGDVTVNGSVGDVRVSGAPSSLDVTTSVGAVSATLREPAESVRLRSSVGDIELRLPEGVEYDVRATSPLDPATVEVPTSGQSEYDVDLTTSVGSITVTGG